MIRVLDWENIRPEEILNRDIRAEEDVSAAVDAVIADVRKNGDAALLRYTERFDGVKLTALEVTAAEIDATWNALDEDFKITLQMAADNIRRFHEKQVQNDFVLTDRPGIVMG